MSTVTYDNRSFLVDGKRIWLVSGTVAYYRLPRGQWRDRLLKARRGGLNCIATEVPWNFHEPFEGQWDFEGRRDVAAFVREAEAAGLYVILKPGPFIGADWPGGGLPAWLSARPGVSLRTDSAGYTHYFDKYLAQLLPRLADSLVTRGGNIILLQAENDYIRTTMPERQAYLGFINQLFRRAGFDLPILASNRLTDPVAPETVEAINTFGEEVRQIKRLRMRQLDAPLVVPSLRYTASDAWGAEHRACEGLSLARRLLESAGCGAQINLDPYCGGTNFEHFAAHLPDGPEAFTATSQDRHAPVAEGGGLSQTYYQLRPVLMMLRNMGPYLADASMDDPPVTIERGTSVLNLVGPRGRWAFVTNNGRDDLREVALTTPDGQRLEVDLGAVGAVALPVEVELTEQLVLDWSNLMPLGLFCGRLLAFVGQGGQAGRICLHGQVLEAEVPRGREPAVHELQGLSVVLLSEEQARQTWVLEEGLAVGPRFVGETLADIQPPEGTSQYCLVAADGSISRKKKTASAAERPSLGLGSWSRRARCAEPVSSDLPWRKIDRPRPMRRLDLPGGYAWYRTRFSVSRGRKQRLFLPHCRDRARMYLNGRYVGTWGVGPDARREPVEVSLRKGENELVLLVEDLGRFAEGFDETLGESKGVFGGIYEGRRLRGVKFRLKPFEDFNRRMLPRGLSHLAGELESLPVFVAQAPLNQRGGGPVQMRFADLPHHLCVRVNDRMVAFQPRNSAGTNFGELTFTNELKKGSNQLQLLLWGAVDESRLRQIEFFQLGEELTAGSPWWVRPWSMPEEESPDGDREDLPAWYEAHFEDPGSDEPLYLSVKGSAKGRIFLNGEDLGRFWDRGPQEAYYLPADFIAEENRLVLFCEDGRRPSGTRMAARALGPFRS